jgi:hypothetical protein
VDRDEMLRVLRAFEAEHLEYVLIGATAMAFHGLVRATEDVDLLGDYPAIRYYPPTGDLYFDVMTRLGEAANFESVEAETKELEGIRVRVATPLALYRLKRETVRALDRQDAAALRERFDLPQGG